MNLLRIPLILIPKIWTCQRAGLADSLPSLFVSKEKNVSESMSRIYIKLVSSMLFWGGTWVAGRVLAQSMPPVSAAFLRFLLASSFLLLVCFQRTSGFPKITKAQILPAALLGLTGVFLYNIFFFSGLKTTSAGRAALIVASIPVCISACSALIFRERFGIFRIVGTLLSLVGVSMVIADGNPLKLMETSVRTGDLYILGCVVAWTAYSIFGKQIMNEMEPLPAVTWSCIFGTAMLFFPALFSGAVSQAVNASPLDWFCVFYLAVPSTGFAFLWYYDGIKAIGAPRAGIFINLVPVFAVIMGFLILSEPIHFSLITGGAMVICGVWMTNRL